MNDVIGADKLTPLEQSLKNMHTDLQKIIDSEVERAIEIHDIEQGIERLDVQCSEGNCKNCDGKRPTLKKLQSKLKALKDNRS